VPRALCPASSTIPEKRETQLSISAEQSCCLLTFHQPNSSLESQKLMTDVKQMNMPLKDSRPVFRTKFHQLLLRERDCTSPSVTDFSLIFNS
jgi:hypothetical protein